MIFEMLAVIEAPFLFFISIFSQTNVRCNCRSSPPQVFFKRDHLIYTCNKCEEE